MAASYLDARVTHLEMIFDGVLVIGAENQSIDYNDRSRFSVMDRAACFE
jgi:hypothetical protein